MKKKCGRKKIDCILGEKKRHTLVCYDYEWTMLRIEYNKLKQQRPKYYIKTETE